VVARGANEPGRALVDDVPVVWVEPEARRSGTQLALWIPWLSGDKEACVPYLRRLAVAGFVAVSLDPWQHGERASGTEVATRVFAEFRREMWPILGHTILDALRVVDWATRTFDTGSDLVAGGVSMGGDIAVALAGIDGRVTRVAAIVATPDWTRPGMHDLADPSRVLPQGEPDALAQWFYDRLDPLTHLDAYARAPAITFECAADDTHVPAEGAQRFQAALRDAFPTAGAAVRVNLHAGLGHLEGARDAALADDALDWLARA
jgi:dienelactone hydrolase